MAPRRDEVVTFKVDRDLMKKLENIPNRSEFIRSALRRALENVCPLCRGSGTLSRAQRQHWESFSRDHSVRECDTCHELRLTCGRAEDGDNDS